MKKKLGDAMSKPTTPNAPEHAPYSDGVDPDSAHLPDDNNYVVLNGTTVFKKPITDQWIHAELNLPQWELLRKAKVVDGSKDRNVEITGSY